MTQFSRSYDVRIDAPVREVFEYCRDPRHLLQGWPGLEVTDVAITPDGVGTTARYLIRPGGAGAFANLMGRFAKDLMVEQIDREYAEVVPDQRIVSKATMTRRYAGRTTRTVNGTAITWLFEPRDGGTRETVGFHEGDLTWWQTLLDRIGAMILSRNVHGMLAAIREGVERRTRTAT